MLSDTISPQRQSLVKRPKKYFLITPSVRASVLGLSFVLLCLLVGLQTTHRVDWWGLTLVASLSSRILDSLAFLLTLLGEPLLTGVVAVVLAYRGWRSRGRYGLAPLLLFVGVGIEIVLKYILPHPGPPWEFTRRLQLPLFFRLSTPLLVHISTPYSFPSGHALRTTFLLALLIEERPHWRIVGWLGIGAMAFSRIYCNDHWVSDVVGGALLGGALAAVAVIRVTGGK